MNIEDLNEEEIYKAIKDGVYEAMWQLFTNATDMPCSDFYNYIKEGVKEAHLEICKDGS